MVEDRRVLDISITFKRTWYISGSRFEIPYILRSGVWRGLKYSHDYNLAIF